MKIVQRFGLILAILAIAGCSGLKLNFQDDLTYVDGLVKNEEYKLALHYIDRQNKKAPNYRQLQQQRPLILEKIKHYEQRTLIQSEKLVKAQRWSDSIELLEKAIEQIPDSQKLTRELKRQNSVRDEKLSQLRYQITLHEARSIKQDRKLYQRLYKLDSSTSITPEIIRERAKSISRELLKWATTYVQEKEALKARNSLKLAGEITPEIRNSSQFKTLLNEIKEIEKGISRAIKKNREIDLEKLVRDFERLFEQKDLIEAQITLIKIEKRFGKIKLSRSLRQRLDNAVSREIEKHMTSGKKFYSKEQIEHAINEWGNVLLLDPANQEALENISRAVKVLKQLQKVRKNKKT